VKDDENKEQKDKITERADEGEKNSSGTVIKLNACSLSHQLSTLQIK
jgi:hypothetical protein